MVPGLVSVTFREKPCEDVIRHAQVAGLKAIEWHGEDHVRHGDLETARRIGESTRAAGLDVAAYGSYYVLGQSEGRGLTFETVLETAEALSTPMIRVWAGYRSPDETSSRTRASIVEEAGSIADLAAAKRIKVVLEFHRDTLTETGRSCAELLADVSHPNVGTYWQPLPELEVSGNLMQLRAVLPWLAGLHVFHWKPTHRDHHPLAQGESDWTQYLTMAKESSDRLNVLLEFVKEGRVEQLYEDAETLLRLLG